MSSGEDYLTELGRGKKMGDFINEFARMEGTCIDAIMAATLEYNSRVAALV
jgi:hypothetical protein